MKGVKIMKKIIIITIILTTLLSTQVFAINVYDYGSDIEMQWIIEIEQELPEHLRIVDNVVLENTVTNYAARVNPDIPDTIYFSNFGHWWMSEQQYKETIKQIYYHELGHCIQLQLNISDFEWRSKVYYEEHIEPITEDFAETFRKYMLEDAYSISYTRKVSMSEYLEKLKRR